MFTGVYPIRLHVPKEFMHFGPKVHIYIYNIYIYIYIYIIIYIYRNRL